IFFFFQAEDGIRDRNVTGVQTCALPISPDGMTTGEQLRAIHQRASALLDRSTELFTRRIAPALDQQGVCIATVANLDDADREHRSEERRVGKECRSRSWP